MKSGELLKEEYVALRSEICQSIAKQHHITLAGYGLVSAAIGYIIGSSAVDWKALLVIPLLFVSMVSLWAVECNRMVRASYYIAYELWPELCAIVGREKADGWETWIRLPIGNEGDFRRWQNQLQQIVIILVPFLISLSSIAIVAIFVRSDSKWFWPVCLFGCTIVILWVLIFRIIRKISDLAVVIPDTGPQACLPNKQAASRGPLVTSRPVSRVVGRTIRSEWKKRGFKAGKMLQCT